MLKIGDFSRLSRISIRMLRYYDECDVLKPACIDDMSGYRFYENEQLYWAFQINFLKDSGFSIAMIKEILANFHNAKELRPYIEKRISELQDEKSRVEEMIQYLKKAEKLLDKEDMLMKYEVEIKDIKGTYVASKRGIIPTYHHEGMLWEGLCKEFEARKMQIAFSNEKPRAYFFDEGYKENEPDVEVCLGVQGNYEDSENVEFKTLKTQTCACVTFKGTYNLISEVSFAIAAWINEHGYELDGPDFCIYHVGYNDQVKEEDFVTEICYPIKKG
ncbi:MAG: MerR family transcriptional regulator [Longicatena sp.]